jgi:hypothetical protein
MIQLIIGLALIGFLVYLIVTYIPMPAPIKNLIMVIVVVCVILWLLQVFGVYDLGPQLPNLRHR